MELEPSVIEAAKAVAIVVAACGSLAATVIAAMNGKRGHKRDENVSAVLKTLGRLDGKVDGLVTRFDRHEAAITERVRTLENEVARIRDERHDRANLLQEAVFAAAKMARQDK